MATDRHQAPSYPLRMPEDLKAQVQIAADANGRSLHAELLHRIQNSFAPPEPDLARQIDLQIENVRSQLTMQDLRIELLKNRFEALRERDRLMRIDADRLLEAPQTDEDFTKADEGVEQLRVVNAEMVQLGAEVDAVVVERKETLERLRQLKAIFAGARVELEERMAAGHAAGSSPDPTTEIL